MRTPATTRVLAADLRVGDRVLTFDGQVLTVAGDPEESGSEGIVEVQVTGNPAEPAFARHWFRDQPLEVAR